ncbi:MAG: SIS domain-containing protein [Bdellovibrionota bacterium]
MKFDNAQAQLNITRYLEDGATVRLEAAKHCAISAAAASALIAESMSAGGKLLLCGNGGSAADCQHVAAEFVSRLTKDFIRPAMAAIALTTDTSFLTAFGNDCGFDGVFERQVEALGKAGDVILGISTSGGSVNVIRALKSAKQIGMKTIALCGKGGEITSHADVSICVPSTNTQYIQECHLALEHIICSLVERAVHG